MKRERSPIDSTEQPHCSKRLMPSKDVCQPISNIDDLDVILKNPPRWAEKVEPLGRRAATLVRNVVLDCHVGINKHLIRNRWDERTIPKTLVCHNYKDGYLLDKYTQFFGDCYLGTGYPFYHWAQIDIFVYFSNHFITIPPLCWINSGHRNGVKVLGTIIINDEGLCNNILFVNRDKMKRFAESLEELTKIFGFDGWLLKIKCKIVDTNMLQAFVRYFTELIHFNNSDHLVIWYDCVTAAGEPLSQNELNSQNRCFFAACDGILLNFHWNDINLKHSVESAKLRNYDVYVGIDVFGKLVHGGGKFNTYKAVEKARRNNLSMAIFAPSWTYESLEHIGTVFEEFLNRNSAFWCSIWIFLYTRPIRNYFTTNFYIGLDEKCYNIFNQQPQLSQYLHPHNKKDISAFENTNTLRDLCDCVQAVPLDSRNCCLLTKQNLQKQLEFVHHLFICDIEIVDNTLVYFLTKNLDLEPTTLSISMLICENNKSHREIRLLGNWKDNPLNSRSILEVNQFVAADVYESIKSKHFEMMEKHKWVLSMYVFNTSLCRLMEVGGIVESGDSIYLGAFGIQKAEFFIRPSHYFLA